LHFGARLALSLGRSSITSNRFLGNEQFATELFLEGVRYLASAGSASLRSGDE
jgi:hypothetical protein